MTITRRLRLVHSAPAEPTLAERQYLPIWPPLSSSTRAKVGVYELEVWKEAQIKGGNAVIEPARFLEAWVPLIYGIKPVPETTAEQRQWKSACAKELFLACGGEGGEVSLSTIRETWRWWESDPSKNVFPKSLPPRLWQVHVNYATTYWILEPRTDMRLLPTRSTYNKA